MCATASSFVRIFPGRFGICDGSPAFKLIQVGGLHGLRGCGFSLRVNVKVETGMTLRFLYEFSFPRTFPTVSQIQIAGAKWNFLQQNMFSFSANTHLTSPPSNVLFLKRICFTGCFNPRVIFRVGHSAAVSSIRFSPHGRWVATGGLDNQVGGGLGVFSGFWLWNCYY